MKLATSILFVSSISLLSGCIVVAKPSYANFHTQKILNIDASTLEEFDIDAGAGTLVINGSDTATQINVIADIYTEKGNRENYQLELSDSGDTAYLMAKINSSSGFWKGDSPHINIKVTMPSHLLLTVEDGSGDIDISNIDAPVSIQDGSGGMSVNKVKGNININDGSGELNLIDIEGNVKIDDGSGSIFVKGISGDAFIEDGSGELTVRNVIGTVTIDDGSGDIDVEHVGNVRILESGSGGLRVKKVSGNFEIDE